MLYLRFIIGVVLIFDLADDFLDQVFDGNQTVDAAEFVNDERHVRTLDAHFEQEFQNMHRRRHEQHLALDIGNPEGVVATTPAEHILDVHHALSIVEGVAVDRQTGMSLCLDDVDDFGERRRNRDRNNVGARHHDIVDGQVAQFENIGDKQPLVRVERHFRVLAFLDQFVKGIAGRIVAAGKPFEAAHPAAHQSGEVAAFALVLGNVGAGFATGRFPVRGRIVHRVVPSNAADARSSAYGSAILRPARISTSRLSICRASASVSWS